MRALVTGATGFVGRNLLQALSDASDVSVVAMARSTRGAKPSAQEQSGSQQSGSQQSAPLDVDWVAGDLADPDSIARAAQDCNVVFHCAGEASHRAAPSALAWLHVAAVENVVNGAEHAGVSRLVLLSCADASLRNRERLNWREDQPVRGEPLDAWCRSKLTGEEVALQRSRPGFTVTAIRPAFLWGADDDVNLPVLCREGLSGGIRLHSAGEHLFSSAHIDNVVHSLRLASKADADAIAGKAFHVTDQSYQTAAEFFGSLSQATGLRGPRRGLYGLGYGLSVGRQLLRVGGPTPAEIALRGRGCLLDIQRAINDLDYAPCTTMESGMEALAAYCAVQGGPRALAARVRKPADGNIARHFERLANGPSHQRY